MTVHDASTVEHPIGVAGRLTVKVADWDVELTAVDGDTATLSNADGGSLPSGIDIEREAGGFTVRQPNRFTGLGVVLGSGRTNVRLSIGVPTATTTNLQSASGDLWITGLTGQQEIRTASGDVTMGGVGGNVTAETVSGDLVIGVERATALAAKTVSGDLAIDGGRIERLGVQTTSGDVRMTSQLGPGPHTIVTVSGDVVLAAHAGIRVSAQTVAGDLRTSLPHTSEGRPGRRSLAVGDGSTDVAFRSVSGDLRVVDATGAATPLAPTPPTPPTPPIAPIPPVPPVPPVPPIAPIAPEAATTADGTDDDRLEILRALERGEIDVDEATTRLAGLDGSTDE